MKVGMLILLQPDLEKATAFYQSLGLPLKFHIKEKWAEFAIGDIKLCLCPISENLGDHHTGVVLEVPDLKAAHESLQAMGVEFINQPVEAVHGIMVSFKDPGGNIIDLYQPTPERLSEFVTKVANQENDGCCSSEQATSCCSEQGC